MGQNLVLKNDMNNSFANRTCVNTAEEIVGQNFEF